MRNYILVDIDHTISDTAWRDHMIGGPWDEYHLASEKDAPLIDVANMLHHLPYNKIGITSRFEKWRGLTYNWLRLYGIPMNELLMRPDNEEGLAPSILKPRLAIERFGSVQGVRENVAFIIDDDPTVIAAFSEIGITCLQATARRDA